MFLSTGQINLPYSTQFSPGHTLLQNLQWLPNVSAQGCILRSHQGPGWGTQMTQAALCCTVDLMEPGNACLPYRSSCCLLHVGRWNGTIFSRFSRGQIKHQSRDPKDGPSLQGEVQAQIPSFGILSHLWPGSKPSPHHHCLWCYICAASISLVRPHSSCHSPSLLLPLGSLSHGPPLNDYFPPSSIATAHSSGPLLRC